MWIRRTTKKNRKDNVETNIDGEAKLRVLFLIHTFISRTRNTININTIYELAHLAFRF